MTNTQTGTLVLKDATGSYFLLPQETAEQGRVPEERKAEIEQAIAEAEADVSGYSIASVPRRHFINTFGELARLAPDDFFYNGDGRRIRVTGNR